MIAAARTGPPSPQLHPTMSAPASARNRAASAGVEPHRVRSMFLSALYWKNMVAITGRSAASLAARMAVVASSGTIIVSTAKKSAPPSASARACSLKLAPSSSSDTSPSGGTVSGRCPDGPMDPATYPSAGQMDRASRAPRTLRSRVRSSRAYGASLRRVPPKVLVSMMLAPASTYARWISRTASGCVSFHSSGQPPSTRPASNNMVPIAPSSTNTSDLSRRSSSLPRESMVSHSLDRPASARVTRTAPGFSFELHCREENLLEVRVRRQRHVPHPPCELIGAPPLRLGDQGHLRAKPRGVPHVGHSIRGERRNQAGTDGAPDAQVVAEPAGEHQPGDPVVGGLRHAL